MHEILMNMKMTNKEGKQFTGTCSFVTVSVVLTVDSVQDRYTYLNLSLPSQPALESAFQH